MGREAAASLRSLPTLARDGGRAFVVQLLERPLKMAVLPIAALCLAFSIAGTSGASGRKQAAAGPVAAPPLFQGSPKLRHLRFATTRLTPKGGLALANSLVDLRSLTHLDLSDNTLVRICFVVALFRC